MRTINTESISSSRQIQTDLSEVMSLSSIHKTFALLTSRYHTSTPVPESSNSLLRLLQFSVTTQSPIRTQQCHARIITTNFSQNPYIVTKLISAYAACEDPASSKLVFESVTDKDVYLWNSLINGYVKNRFFSEALRLFSQMCRNGVAPDDYTVASVSKVAGETGDLFSGKLVHAKSIRSGFVLDVVVGNSVMSMYSKCGEFRDAEEMFSEMPERNVASWNVLIGGIAGSGDGCNKKIWEVVRSIQEEGVQPDGYTVSSLLPLCGGSMGKCDYGKELHCYVLKSNIDLALGADVHLGCCLIDMYSRGDRLLLARRVFDNLNCRNVYAWTAMINGYVQEEAPEEAFSLFNEMQVMDGIEPNRVTLISVLPACSTFAGLMTVKQIHGFVIRKDINDEAEVSLQNALIDAYSKCGNLGSARRVFEDIPSKDAISWSSIISAYGLHGKGEGAILLYNEMVQHGLRPDMITIIGVLSACARCGLVDQGLDIYRSVINDYGIRPTVEICACVVDILGRSNQLDRAVDYINNMPVKAGPTIWGALLNASILHGNCDMQNLAHDSLLKLEPENPSNYISLSNLYASSNKWGVVADVRKTMKERGLRKAPGCSWISINGCTSCFYVSDCVHPFSSSIYEMLDALVIMMKGSSGSVDSENLI